MDLLEIVTLAVVQGITEFLPISSSGHVVVLAELFDGLGETTGGEKLTVNIVLHVGTLAAILVFYWGRICRLLGRDRRVLGLLIVGSVPAAVVGLTLKSQFSDAMESALLAGLMFPLTGAMLLSSARVNAGSDTCGELSVARAVLIGMFQAFAILPGISRSGATIVAGLGCGLKRDEAAAFSFLLAIPAIGGAGLLEAIDLLRKPSDQPQLGLLALGAGLSFAVGLASLAWLIKWLQQGRLYLFAWWVLPLGPVVILWQLWCP